MSTLRHQLTASTESLLNYNRRRKIDNPLFHHDLARLDRLARQFARLVNSDAPDDRLFMVAARIAQDPPNWKNTDCTLQERAVLDEERELPFRKQSKALQLSVITLCFSAIIQGWVQSVLNGANQTLPEAFNLKDPQTHEWTGSSSLWIFAGLNAIPYLTASIFGCWISDPLQSKYLGRRGAIFASACLCFASVIGCAFTRTWQQLMLCRAILGLGLGAKASVTPIFGAEISPIHLRGALVMNWQLFDVTGIVLGYTANIILASTGWISWRLQIASACIPAACLITLIWTIPESPRWLLKQDNFPAAYASMCALRKIPLQAAIELLYANEQIQAEVEFLPSKSVTAEAESSTAVHVEDIAETVPLDRFQQSVRNTSYWIRVLQLFRNPRTRRATVAAAVVMLGQQLCGINVLAFYSTTFFRDINGVSSNSTPALWMSWGVGVANLLFTIPAYYRIDTRGRRFLLLVSYPGMIVCLLGSCLSFLRKEDNVRLGLVVTFLLLFVAFYAVGQGPVAFAYASEVFPLFNREAGMSFAVFVNLFGAGILTLLVPQAQATQVAPITHEDGSWQLTQIRLLASFTALCTVSFILIFLFVPDTAGTAIEREEGQLNYMYLEQLNYIFGVPTWNQIQYQYKSYLPTAAKMIRYQLGRLVSADFERPEFEIMYKWAEARTNGDNDTGNQNVNGNENEDNGASATTEHPAPTNATNELHQATVSDSLDQQLTTGDTQDAFEMTRLQIERRDSWPL